MAWLGTNQEGSLYNKSREAATKSCGDGVISDNFFGKYAVPFALLQAQGERTFLTVFCRLLTVIGGGDLYTALDLFQHDMHIHGL